MYEVNETHSITLRRAVRTADAHGRDNRERRSTHEVLGIAISGNLYPSTARVREACHIFAPGARHS